jgi:hypothetical protein
VAACGPSRRLARARPFSLPCPRRPSPLDRARVYPASIPFFRAELIKMMEMKKSIHLVICHGA